jgi:hypothetical protein
MNALRTCLLLSLGVVALGLLFPAACSHSDSSLSQTETQAGQAGAAPSGGTAGKAGQGGTAGKAGNGGASGQGGSGGVAGEPQGGQAGSSDCLEGEPPWACDPSYWLPTPVEANSCDFKQIDLNKAVFQPLQWSSCGPGCDITKIHFDKVNKAYHSSGAFLQEGEMYLKLDTGWAEPKPQRMSLILRVSDSTVYSAYKSNAESCGTLQYARNTPSHMIYYAYPKGSNESGYASGKFFNDKGILWNSTIIENLGIPAAAFEFDQGWGIVAGGLVGLHTSSNQKIFQVIGASPAYSAKGHGSEIVWPGPPVSGLFQTLRRYSKTDGTSIILEKSVTSTINSVALSDKYLAWINTDGIGGKYEKAFLSWTPHPSLPSPIPLDTIQTMEIPAATGISQLHTLGEFAVTAAHTSEELGSYRMIFVHLATKKMWQIPHPPGNWFFWVLGMSPKEILVSVKTDLAGQPTSFDKIIRLRLDRLDEIEAAWQPVP